MSAKVIIVSSEAAPFSKTGGLGDVAGNLPVALKKLGCQAALFLPYYRSTAEAEPNIEATGLTVTVPIAGRQLTAQVLRASYDGVPVYFIKRDEYYDRKYLYGTPEGDYFDNLERYVFFCRCVLEAVKALGVMPDVIHCNDWQTGLIPAYLRDVYRNDVFFSKTATVFTLHNIAYQGIFGPEFYNHTGLSRELFSPDGLEFWGNLNLLKSGVVYAAIITTVSETYSKEIQTAEFGCGLEGVLKKRRANLTGIVNGVNYDEWDPSKDKLIPANYSPDDLAGKSACKKAVLDEFGLKSKPDRPLAGMVSRLAEQKGFDLLAKAASDIASLDMRLVIVGSGDKKYQEQTLALAKKYPDRLAVKIAFDNRLAHLVEAGSDLFLMPSKYEPCGLNQIYSLKYGTIPVVMATGGLQDTVIQYDGHKGTGFKFKKHTAEAFVAQIKEALAVYKDRQAWVALQRAAMAEDYSWEASARKYVNVYERAAVFAAATKKRA